MTAESIRQHWQEINATKQDLQNTPGAIGKDGELYIVSKKDRKRGIVAGRVSVVRLDQAALHLAAGTHELASPEQIAEWNAQQKAVRDAQQQEQAKRDSKINLDMTPFAQLLSQAMATPVAAPPAGGKTKNASE